jgi:hypothetical protein
MTSQNARDPNSLRARIDALVQEALDLAERSNLDARMHRAVKLVAEGRLTYRAIAGECGYKSPGSVHRAAQQFGLLTVHEVRRQQLPEVREARRLRAARAQLQRIDAELWQEMAE